MVASAAVGPAGIVFDLDGTLVDSRPDLATAVNRTRAELGLPPLAVDAITAMVGEGAQTLLVRALPDTLRGDEFTAAMHRFLDVYLDCCLDATRPYEGVPEAVAALAARHRLAVLTNKPERHSRKVLGGLGLLAPFEIVIGGDTLPTRKPDPAGLLGIAAAWGLPPGDVVLVGDRVVDAQTARAAGAGLALVDWGFADVASLAGPGDRRFASAAELARAFA